MVKKQVRLGLENTGNQKKATDGPRQAAGPAVSAAGSAVLGHSTFPKRIAALRLIPRMLGDYHAKALGQSVTPLINHQPLID